MMQTEQQAESSKKIHVAEEIGVPTLCPHFEEKIFRGFTSIPPQPNYPPPPQFELSRTFLNILK